MFVKKTGHICVLGAGIQGSCAALALADIGWRVTVVDRLPRPMSATSGVGEGKIHLGYVYANDPEDVTAGLMIEGALSFSRLLDGWLPRPVDWRSLTSDPFMYGVVNDSLLSACELEAHYESVDRQIDLRLEAGGDYLGVTTPQPARRIGDPRAVRLGGDVAAAFTTGEHAVDVPRLSHQLIGALAHAGVDLRTRHEVTEVLRRENGFRVRCRGPQDEPTHFDADVVVNCLWDGRLVIDETLGIHPDRQCSYRLRYALRGTAATGVAPSSTTFVLGPYGDIVHWPNGQVYASWYPTGATDWCDGISVPSEWRHTILHGPSPEHAASLETSAVAALSQLAPAIVDVRIDAIRAGVVVAWGSSDIDDPTSELHTRSAIGVHDHDGYFSIDTGKLTTAPLFASQAARTIGTARANA